MQVKTPVWAMFLVIALTLAIPFAQVLIKQGVATLNLEFSMLLVNLLNLKLVLGAVIYITASLLLIFALKHGELSVLYPLFGLNYVWVNLAAFFYLGEPYTLGKLLGIAVILFGVVAIGRSTPKEAAA